VTSPRAGAPPGDAANRHPHAGPTTLNTATTTAAPVIVTAAEPIPVQLRRRREASRRREALSCGRHRDPLGCLVAPAGPSTFGLTEDELALEARRLWLASWSVEEITTVLDIAPKATP